MKIYPSILFDKKEEAEEWIKKAAETEKYERMQVDFVDGEYTTHKTVPVEAFIFIKKYPHIKFDAHLMVTQNNIDKYLSECKQAGFDRIIVQMESVSNPEKYQALSIDIHSPVKSIEPYLKNLNYINVMSIEPGFGGQKLRDEVIKKIKLLSEWREFHKFKYLICVDGGVEKEMLPELEKLGVDEVVVGVKRLLQW